MQMILRKRYVESWLNVLFWKKEAYYVITCIRKFHKNFKISALHLNFLQ